MEQLVTSDFRLGIIAGGQLGKMLVLAASNWDVNTYVLDDDAHCPAAPACTRFVQGSRHSFDDVVAFGRMVDMITFEIEDVNIDALRALKAEGRRIVPDPETLAVIQDKGRQKDFYAAHGIPTAPYSLYESSADIRRAVAEGRLVPPFVQKLRLGGYDGKGVAVIESADQLAALLEGPSVVEQRIDIAKEISIIAARNARGEVRCFPAVEMVFDARANLVDRLFCPAGIPDHLQADAVRLATELVTALDLSGLLAVEMFVDTAGALWVNEVAPRAHNSGHHSIESVITSQFEQQLRAIFNFPLGSTRLKMPAVMVNLLGEPDCSGAVRYEGMTECMGVDGVKIHLYGKTHTRPFRKMGHVTVMAPTLEEAMEKASVVKQTLKVRSW
ncbi:MAG: 5-(carboxyamino)imidazole ribonucleotide synthase [Bacteroidetes bacterium]|nr:5-(carboxyamino)imidazole ribonucleotide synthase [Bacteroidota bacterium]